MLYLPPTAKRGVPHLGADERGFAVPTVLAMMLAAFAFVTVGVVSSISAQRGTVRDERSKSALEAAEAGISQALLRYNTYSSTTSPLTASNPCIGASGSPAATTAGWCSGVNATINGGAATYYVKPVWTSGYPSSIEVVSLGNVSGVTRREDVTATSASGQQVFAAAAVKAEDWIHLDSNAQVAATAQTGGDYTMDSNSKQCGLATVGVGKHMIPSGNAKYYTNETCSTLGNTATVGTAALTLPPVNQGDAATLNDNARITSAATGTGTPSDLVSGNRADISWNASTRQLTINHNSSLTLTGTKYSFCKLTLNSNSSIYVAAGLNVTMFFDSPEACGLTPVGGTVTQLLLSSNSRITDATGSTSAVAMLFVGSSSVSTTLQMNSNTQVSGACVQNFVVYAPLTNVSMNSNSQYCGSLAAKTLDMNSNSLIQVGTNSSSYVLPGTPPHFALGKLVECSTSFTSPPNSGC